MWTFDKCAVAEGVWRGTATGPDGTVSPMETRLTSIHVTGPVWHVGFDWHVFGVYLAKLTGTLNTSTGAVVMNGQVANGQYAGSAVHEEGTMTDAARSCFAGTIRVMPASG
jgi:hypothetical protein